VIRRVGYAVAVLLLGVVAWRAVSGTAHESLHPVWLVPAIGAALVYWLGLATTWRTLSGTPMRLWVRTQLLRYLPGGFWGPAARAVQSAPRYVIAENVLSIAVAAAAAGVALHWAPLAVASAAVLVAVVVRWPRLAAPAAGYVVAFVAFAVACLSAQRALGPVPHPGHIVGAALLGWVIGVVIIGAPGGLGAREAAYVWLAAGVLPSRQLAGGALVARLAMLAAEVAVLVALYSLRPRHGHPVAQPDIRGQAEIAQPGDVDLDGRHLAGFGRHVAHR
jgi:hypothetical protein